MTAGIDPSEPVSRAETARLAGATDPIRVATADRSSDSWRAVRLWTAFSLAIVIASALAGILVPLMVFFAVGAGAGYSLSGSV